MQRLRGLVIPVLMLLLPLLCAAGALAPAEAQISYSIPNQGILQYNTASVTMVNTTAATALWSSLIPGAYTATSPNTNTVYSPSFVVTPPPLHLVLQGSLSTNIATAGVGTMNIGVNYGGGSTGVASLALANAISFHQNLAAVPYQIDVWLSPVATATNTAIPGAGACFFYMSARMTVATSSFSGVLGAAPVTLDAHTCGTTGGAFLASAQQLNVLANWASASSTNSLSVYRGTLLLGF